MFLAESSEVFCRHLLVSDALVALFAELPTLSPEQDEELLHSVLDNAIANDRPPWWQIPPRGEPPFDALARHRPRNIGTFLRPYLEHPEEIPQLWGTTCVAAWGGTKSLNNILDRTAHDLQRNVEARIWAIEAIAATKDAETFTHFMTSLMIQMTKFEHRCSKPIANLTLQPPENSLPG